MKILILVGSADKVSHSLSLGSEFKEQFQKLGAETELINLSEYSLPVYDRAIERTDSYDQKTRDFLAKSYEVDAFVWVTPIYHNSFSSMLKNALDWQHTKFPGKVVGLASHGGNRSTQAVDQLMFIARAQHLMATNARVCTDAADFDDQFKVSNQDIKNRIIDMSKEIIDLSKKLS